MNKTSLTLAIIAGLALIAGVISYFNNFDASVIACKDIAATEISLNAQYEQAMAKGPEVYRDQKQIIDATLTQCLNAPLKNPCANEQKAFDEAVQKFNSIKSPPEGAPYAEFKAYFEARDKAYEGYPAIRDALFSCQKNNKPPQDVPYEKSDTKKCFDEYDSADAAARETLNANAQALRAGLKNALASLEARRKACNPPLPIAVGRTGDNGTGEGTGGGTTAPTELLSCQPIDANFDSELYTLRQRAAQIPVEIADVQKSIDNANSHIRKLEQALRDTPNSTPTYADGPQKGQIITNLPEAQAARGVIAKDIGEKIDFLKAYIDRKKVEKSRLEDELEEINAKIAARLSDIQKENAERQSKYPTSMHLAKPDKCAYFHCHGMICGIPDPDPHGCGQGPTTEDDISCKQFLKSYLNARGVY